ncbi:MAG TPA: CsbD family protein [Burkholderiales bacterium]|nr:CsbD family protein [Burkholderiales bacterium]
MNKDQVKGRIKEANGKVKEVAGKMVGNKRLQEKGRIQKAAGIAQADIADAKNDLAKGV